MSRGGEAARPSLWRRLRGADAGRAQTQPARPHGHLFILGAARSGTTVLQNALNDDPDVFLLGEPDLRHDTEADFAARYNAMHRSWRNQETKSTFLPPSAGADGTWSEHLDALSRHHRWVGAKLVLNARREPDHLAATFDFHARRFPDARYLFTFRDPLAAALSTRGLQLLTTGETDGMRAILRNLAEAVVLYVRMLRNLPHVRAVFHDRAGPALFAELGAWLDLPLEGAAAYYDAGRVRAHDPSVLDAADQRPMALLRELYADLGRGVAEGFRTPQLEQNDGHLSAEHFTLLGSIDRRARLIAAELS